MWWNNNVRSLLFILFGCGLFTPAFAQKDSIAPFDKGTHHLYFSTTFDLNASSLTNDLIGQYYKGAYLPDELRTRNSNRMNDNNTAGYSLDGGLYYFFAPNHYKGKFGYYIGVEEHSFAEISFRKSFFDLLFFGNEPYSDQFVKFDNMKLNIMAYQQVKAGVFKVFKGKNGMHQLGWAFGFNIGQKNLCIDVRKASLFTQKDGEYVALDMDMDVFKTDSNSEGFGSFNGYGGAMDFSYNYTDLKQHEFQLRLSNLGYIRWDGFPDNFTRDTTVKFDGFEADIFDLDQPMFNSDFGDSLTQAIIGSDHQGAYVSKLPLEIDVIYTYYVNGTPFTLTTEAKHRFFSVYKPFISFSPGYRIFIKKSSLNINPIMTYGGYGSWNFGLNMKAQINGRTFLGLGTSTLNSIISPRSSAGLSGFFTLYQSL